MLSWEAGGAGLSNVALVARLRAYVAESLCGWIESLRG